MPRTPRGERTFDALPDTIDFRDTLFVPTLVRVPPQTDVAAYRAQQVPVLDQGREGACTGFGLATVANYLARVRGQDPSADEVSAWMIYSMAKRYDEWPGESYDGSSARGAMKGWHKHGVCAKRLWADRHPDTALNVERAADAIRRPLGAYFRVNHRDLVAMHAAISEVGILYATATVHAGWQAVREGDEAIAYKPGAIGGHAFAIVGYNGQGFWLQNSWGPRWGTGGLALLSYADWLANGTDVWVAALGAPVRLAGTLAPATMRAGAPRSYESQVYAALRPHIVTARNDGVLDDKGVYGLTDEGLRDILRARLPAITKRWGTKRVLLYAHGGLVGEDAAIQTVANNREALLEAQVYPLSFIWRSDAWSTLANILREAVSRRRDEGLLDKAKDFMLDRLDDTLEPLACLLGGKALWNEMKENARLATRGKHGAARLAADHLLAARAAGEIDEIHLVGHSAGAIFHAELARYLVADGATISSLTLFAPACTMALFDETYRPLVEGGQIEAFDLYTLDDGTERDDDCANIYNKSLLYLVSAAFEKRPRIFGLGGTPLLGLERDARAIDKAFWQAAARRWHMSPGPVASARHHGDFDNDAATLASTLKRITGRAAGAAAERAAPATARRARRRQLDEALAR